MRRSSEQRVVRDRARGVCRALGSALVALALGAAGCLGGQTGSEAPVGGKGPGSECAAAARALAWDEASPLGFLPEDLLPLLQREHASSLIWHDQLGLAQFGPEHGETAVILAVQAPVGTPRLVHFFATSKETGAHCAPDHVEFEASVSVTTSGGALAEQFLATFSASDAEAVRFRVSLPLAHWMGTLAITPIAGFSTDALLLEAELSSEPARGWLRGELATEAASAELVTYACWPSQSALCRAALEP
jgi:hypothetical protein